jgi:hypothetical protein
MDFILQMLWIYVIIKPIFDLNAMYDYGITFEMCSVCDNA